MAWNIDDACVNRLASGRGQIQFGETELNRDLPRFFFRQAVGISSSQRFHQRALPVVHVTRGGDDEMPGRHVSFPNHEGHEAHEGLQHGAFDSILQLCGVEVFNAFDF